MLIPLGYIFTPGVFIVTERIHSETILRLLPCAFCIITYTCTGISVVMNIKNTCIKHNTQHARETHNI